MAERSLTRKRTARPKSKWVRRAKQLIALGAIAGLLAVAGGLILYLPYQREAQEQTENLEKLFALQDPKPSVILSADNVVLYSISMLRRKTVDLKTLPKYVSTAIVAAEDRRFFDHSGVDLRGLSRAFSTLVVDHRASQGGSTIEMQLAKILVNGSQRSMSRKLRDIALAQQIAQIKSKDEILNLYANQVYFGEGAYGIQAAAETYFNKDAKSLTVAEAAMLARCVRTPSRQNPVKDPEGSVDRRNYVLGVMKEEHWITQAQYEESLREAPKLNTNPPVGQEFKRMEAGYFVDHVKAIFARDFPGVDLRAGGYRIQTTLDYALQKEATGAVRDCIEENRRRKVNDMGVLMADQDGHILAEVGGPDYAKRAHNVVTQGRRQPGSAFKPFVYATAIKEGKITADSMVSNEPITLPGDPPYRPHNNGKEREGGNMTVTAAIRDSFNIPAVRTIADVGPDTVVNYAHMAFGFKSNLRAFYSLALGTSEVTPIEMAEGYSVFMLRGDRVHPIPILKVVSPEGVVLKEYEPMRTRNVFDSKICEDMDRILGEVVLHGTGYPAHDVPGARGKTGTTSDAKDAWFCGYANGIVGVVWAGNSGKAVHGISPALPMANNVYGGTISCGVWAKLMLAAQKHHNDAVKVATPAGGISVTATTKEDEIEPPVPAVNEADGTPIPPNEALPPATNPAGAEPMPATDPASTPPGEPGATPAPTKKPLPPSTEDEDTVSVEVCADTGMKAGTYCSETVTRKFKRGTEPRKVCTLHHG